jgi:hypothetical protein
LVLVRRICRISPFVPHFGDECHSLSKAENPKPLKLLKGRQSKFKSWRPGADDVVCFNGKSPDSTSALRIFFDATAFSELESRGWDVAGKRAAM